MQLRRIKSSHKLVCCCVLLSNQCVVLYTTHRCKQRIMMATVENILKNANEGMLLTASIKKPPFIYYC